MRREGQKSKSCGASPRTLEAAGHFEFGLLLTPAASRNFSPAPAGFFLGAPQLPERPFQRRGIERRDAVFDDRAVVRIRRNNPRSARKAFASRLSSVGRGRLGPMPRRHRGLGCLGWPNPQRKPPSMRRCLLRTMSYPSEFSRFIRKVRAGNSSRRCSPCVTRFTEDEEKTGAARPRSTTAGRLDRPTHTV